MTDESFLADFHENEKTAFIGTIASLAIVDNVATMEEIDTISSLAEAAGLSDSNRDKVLNIAKGISDSDFESWMDTLKNSELRFSLVTELISFAKSDGQYSVQEKQKIEEISSRLGINSQQFSVLDQFVSKSHESGASAEPSKQGFMESMGMGDMFKKSGISMSGLSKGLIAIAAPMLLAKLFGSRKGGIGGMAGGMKNMLGAAGLTSLLGMLSGGRGFSKTGGMLSGILKNLKGAGTKY